MTETAFADFLRAKRSIDQFSLLARLPQFLAATLPAKARVLELGAGDGSGTRRLWADGVAAEGDFTLMDSSETLLSRGLHRLSAEPLRGARQLVAICSQLCDDPFPDGPWNLIVAQAVLDLFSLSEILPWIAAGIDAGTYCWFTINYDHMTRWLPALDPELDQRIEAAYNRSMDERMRREKPSGDSRCGSRLFQELPAQGYGIIDAGASDWIVHPGKAAYPNDHAVFLHSMLQFHRESLTGRSEVSTRELDSWLHERTCQIEAGIATLLVHNYDVLAVKV